MTEKVKRALLAMQRHNWEQGVAAQAFLEAGDNDLAIAMAAEAYGKLREMVEQESAGRRYIWSVGRFQGGHVHNVVADRCEMDISFRFYDMDFAKSVEEKTRKICQAIAQARGGSVEIDWHMSTGAVYNTAGGGGH